MQRISCPYPEEIRLMADLYNTPELENYYCTEMCPLGYGMQKVEIEDLDRISLKALDSFRRIDPTAGLLLDITADGVITEDEKPVNELPVKVAGTVEQKIKWLKLGGV